MFFDGQLQTLFGSFALRRVSDVCKQLTSLIAVSANISAALKIEQTQSQR